MQLAAESLISFFNQVVLKNKATLEKLNKEQCFTLDDEKWQFYLPDLHSFLQQQDNIFSNTDYKSFRKILFSCPINDTVKSKGGEIIISDNQGNVDKSRYTLLWK